MPNFETATPTSCGLCKVGLTAGTDAYQCLFCDNLFVVCVECASSPIFKEKHEHDREMLDIWTVPYVNTQQSLIEDPICVNDPTNSVTCTSAFTHVSLRSTKSDHPSQQSTLGNVLQRGHEVNDFTSNETQDASNPAAIFEAGVQNDNGSHQEFSLSSTKSQTTPTPAEYSKPAMLLKGKQGNGVDLFSYMAKSEVNDHSSSEQHPLRNETAQKRAQRRVHEKPMQRSAEKRQHLATAVLQNRMSSDERIRRAQMRRKQLEDQAREEVFARQQVKEARFSSSSSTEIVGLFCETKIF